MVPLYKLLLQCSNCTRPDVSLTLAVAKTDRNNYISFRTERLVCQDLLGLRLKVVWQGAL